MKVIIALVILYFGTVGYDTFMGVRDYQQKQQNASKTCLMDFSKQNCNPVSPSESCRPLMQCAMGNIISKSTFSALLEILFAEIKENCMMPALGIGLLLVYRLCEILNHAKIKAE